MRTCTVDSGNCKMARNSEKRLSGLNRFLEAKEAEKNSEKQRPPLCRLHTADDVKGWIPSIQREINYLLMQIEGTGSRKHRDSKIEEFQERIQYLEQEHKRFVAKVRTLDPSYQSVMPWQPRAYSRKRRGRGGGEGLAEDVNEEPQTKKLYSPLLAREKGGPSRKKPVSSEPDNADYSEQHVPFGSIGHEVVPHSSLQESNSIPQEMHSRLQESTMEKGSEVNSKWSSPRGGVLLGLDYDSSSSCEDD